MAVTLTLRSEEVTRDVHEAGIVDRAVITLPSAFSEDLVEAAGKRLMKQYALFHLLRLTIGTDAAELARSLGDAPVDVPAYDYALSTIGRYGVPSHPIGRFLATPAGALLSISDTRGLRERLVAGKKDPTLTRAGETTYRLLHFQLQSAPAHRTGAALGRAVTLYFSTDTKLSIADAQELAVNLRRTLGIEDIAVHVRNDAWFFSRMYPDIFRFAMLPPLPSKKTYDSEPSVSCAFINKHLECKGTHLVSE